VGAALAAKSEAKAAPTKMQMLKNVHFQILFS